MEPWPWFGFVCIVTSAIRGPSERRDGPINAMGGATIASAVTEAELPD